MDLENLVGETLDGKYRIEKELGKGGMGAVYLATHLGTERPVALKVIVPQFMQRTEFVERFRREARAAGRLRHPNVVDVTDFGFAETPQGKVAYLVMEYLDGCTLGEILQEEKKMPLTWTLDILEQVSSAVHEAHEQGIVHRDLKPDNIWLEPNQRGSYTVKVLDFGIAKLEAAPGNHQAEAEISSSAKKSVPTRAIRQNETNADEISAPTISDKRAAAIHTEKQTLIDTKSAKLTAAEAGTLIQPSETANEKQTLIQPLAEIASESGTAMMAKNETADSDAVGTKILTSERLETAGGVPDETSSLTRVGAVLGTPLYMSPEQCRGEHLDARSDIYSLAVIAYQMLAGKTPFDGDFKSVMDAHKESAPPTLESKKVPRKVKQTIMSALAKNADERPPTAQIFADEMRAQSEGIGMLLQRALIIYSEHLPKFLGLTILLYAPVIFINVLTITYRVATINQTGNGLTVAIVEGGLSLLSVFFSFLSVYLLVGTTTWLVTQKLAFPLRPLALRPALKATRKKWKPLIKTGFLGTFLTFTGLLFCGLGFPVLSVLFALAAPVAMMENLRGFAALKRSIKLVRRSPLTTTALIMIMYAIPLIFSFLIAMAAKGVVRSFDNIGNKSAVVSSEKTEKSSNETANANPQNTDADNNDDGKQVNITIGNEDNVIVGNKKEKDVRERIRDTIQQSLTQILILPFSILVASLSTIIYALLYLKTRRIGGESIEDLLVQFEEFDQPQSNWQKRVRERLVLSGKSGSRTSSTERQSRG